jgi:hypothetical protein
MFRGAIAVLFIGAVVTGLSSTGYAQQRVQPQPEGSFTTRSGESLRVEGRSVSKDFKTPTPATPSNSVPAPVSLPHNSEAVTQPQSLTVFGQKIDFGHRRTSPASDTNSGNRAPSHLEMRNVEVSAGASSMDSQQIFKVQYQMLSPQEKK